MAGAAGATGGSGNVLAGAAARGAGAGTGATNGGGAVTGGVGAVAMAGAGATCTHSVAPPTKALTAGLVEQKVERDPPGGAGGEVDRALLLDGALRGLVMKARVEVVDDPQLLEISPRAVHELHVVRHPVAHLAGQRAGDVDEHVVLGVHGSRAKRHR
jgi:hypothetical protein